MDIKGFYHVCFINNWKTIVKEQVKKIVDSKLYDKTSTIYIGCCGGSIVDKNSLSFMISPFPKFKIVYFNTDRRVYEIPTLQYLQDTCNVLKFSPKINARYKRRELMDKLFGVQQFEIILEDFLLWYIHTKGVTSGEHKRRQELEEATINQHNKCIMVLERNKDIGCCGIGLRSWQGAVAATGYNPPYGGWHFSGNFWWARASHIIEENLTNIFLTSNSRYAAEAFIGRMPNARKMMGELNNYDCFGIKKSTRIENRKNLLAQLGEK